MYISQNYKFFNILYDSEIISFQLEGGVFDHQTLSFLYVEALRFNLQQGDNEHTLRIHYDYESFECHDEYTTCNGFFGICRGQIVEFEPSFLQFASIPKTLDSLSADVIDCWSDDCEDMASFCNLYFDFDAFILKVEYDFTTGCLVVKSEDTRDNTYQDDSTCLRKILPDGRLA